MTPAAALTQAAMDVTPAYATDVEGSPNLSAKPLTSWNNLSLVDGDKVTISSIVPPTDLKYNGEAEEQGLSAGAYAVEIKVDYVAEGRDNEYYKLGSGLYTVAETTSSNDMTQAGTYNMTITATSDGPKVADDGAGTVNTTSGSPTNLKGTKNVTIAKAVAVIKTGSTILHSTTPAEAAATVTVTGVKGPLVAGADKDFKAEPVGADDAVLGDPDLNAPVTANAPVRVKVTLVDNGTTKAATNYTLVEGGDTDTTYVDVPVANKGTYDINWATGAPAGSVVTANAATPTVGVAQYTGVKLDDTSDNAKDNDFLARDMKATFTADTLGAQKQPVDMSSFEIDWFEADGKTLVVDADGHKAAPFAPGKYVAKFCAPGAAEGDYLDETLTLTVQADLSSALVDMNGAADSGEHIWVTVGGRAPQKVELKFEKGLTEAQLKQQIWDALEVTYDSYGGPDEVENADELFDLKPVNFVAGSDAPGVVEMTYKGNDGRFTGMVKLDYKFGVPFPTFGDLKPVAYNPNGYVAAKLVPQTIKDEDGNTLKISTNGTNNEYTVQAYAVNPSTGKEETTTNITNVGSYKIVVAPTAGSDYVGTPQTLTQVIEPMPVTARNTTLAWDGKTPVNGLVTVPFDGEPATPEVTGTFTVDTADPALVQPPTNTVEIESGDIPTKAEYDRMTAADKKGVVGYVEFSNNENATPQGQHATATVTFLNNYSGTLTQDFVIEATDLDDLDDFDAVAASQIKSEFNLDNQLSPSDVKDPVVTFSKGGETVTLEEGVDYRVTRAYIDTDQSDLIGGATRYVFDIEGIGNYSGTATGEFVVTTKALDEETFAAALAQPNAKYFYGQEGFGKEVVPAGTELATNYGGVTVKFRANTSSGVGEVLDRDEYAVTFENNVNASTEDAPAYAVITGIGNYAGQIKVPYRIEALNLDGASAAKIELSGADNLVYNGKEQKPEVVINKSSVKPTNEGCTMTVQLKDVVDQITYDTYESNVNAGTGYVVIAGKGGNIVGSVKAPFDIAKADVAKAEVAGPKAPVAPGTALADAVVVTLDGVELTADDYTVASEDAVPGAAGVTVTGQGNLTGTKAADVTVLYDVAGLSYKVSSGTYNGQSQTPVVTATYKDASGKTVDVPASALNVAAGSYVNAGKYKIKVTGNAAAGWGGEATVDYVIAPATVTAKPQVSYDAAGLPVVTVPGLTSNDFDWKADAATKTITVTYKGNYAGTATVAYAPTAKPVAPAKPAAGKTGWVGSGNDWAYYEDGQQVKGGWKFIDGAWYHFEANGKMTTATKSNPWFQDKDGTWYMLDYRHDGQYGAMLTGWQKTGGDWYYFAKSGAMQSGWAKVDGEWYLLNSKHDGTFGAMLTGWQKVGGKWYYMDASGAMASNEWVGRYWVNGSGVWTATR